MVFHLERLAPGRGLWTSDLSTAPGDTLRVLHRLAAHYLAAVKSSPLGRSSSATAVLVMASLLELFEITSKSSTGGGVFSRIIGKSGSAPLWSLQPWEKPDGRPASFADLTAWLPMVSPAQCHPDQADVYSIFMFALFALLLPIYSYASKWIQVDGWIGR